MTAFAIRQRSFSDPHPISEIKTQALEARRKFEAKRSAEIKRLMEETPGTDKFSATLMYDLELAPTTTGRAILLEHGLVPVPPQELTTNSVVHDELWTVLEALAQSGVFILNTDHLTDRDLYTRLYYRILDEPCRCIPPVCEAAEYIDCLHPMDLEHSLGQLLLKRQLEGDSFPRSPEYQRGPQDATLGALQSRDSYLPRPTWG